MYSQCSYFGALAAELRQFVDALLGDNSGVYVEAHDLCPLEHFPGLLRPFGQFSRGASIVGHSVGGLLSAVCVLTVADGFEDRWRWKAVPPGCHFHVTVGRCTDGTGCRYHAGHRVV